MPVGYTLDNRILDKVGCLETKEKESLGDGGGAP